MKETMQLMIIFVFLVTCVVLGCDDASEASDSTELSIEAVIQPDPPVAGQNTMEITISDSNGPVEGALVTVDPQMPMHGHGSSDVPAVEDLGGGTYRAFPVTFTMPGSWEVTVTVAAPSGSALFKYEVQ